MVTLSTMHTCYTDAGHVKNVMYYQQTSISLKIYCNVYVSVCGYVTGCVKCNHMEFNPYGGTWKVTWGGGLGSLLVCSNLLIVKHMCVL